MQQQQPQTAIRARCMLVHRSNIEIDSNDSLFFLRKTRESKRKKNSVQCRARDSNLGPRIYEVNALPIELSFQMKLGKN